MKVWMATMGYVPIEVLQNSLAQVYATRTTEHEHIVVDHHWPLDTFTHSGAILIGAQRYGYKIMRPYQNLGGHGGYNWLLQNIPIEDDDLFITVDGDSCPVARGWDKALVGAMELNPNYAAMSLMIDADLFTKNWLPMAAFDFHVVRSEHGREMMNITAWRYSFLKAVGLFTAGGKYYGGLEIPMFDRMKELGLQHGYLADFKEIPSTVYGDKRYHDWKVAHITGRFPGNFDEYLKVGDA